MLVYWILFLMLTTGSLLTNEQAARRSGLLFLSIASLPAALMIGLRWEIGPDWTGYLIIFKYTAYYSFAQAAAHTDPGFFLLVWLLQRVDAPFWTLNLICGICFIAGLTAFSRRQPNPWLAFLVAFPYLVIVVAMSGERQSLALAFLFFALNAFEQKRLTRFVLLILAGAMFHGSVLLLIPLGLLSYAENSVQRALLLLLVIGVGYYVTQHAFEIYTQRYSIDKEQSSGAPFRLAMNSLAAILFFIFRGKLRFGDHEALLWRNVSLATLGLVLLFFVAPSSTAVDRILLYLFPLQFVVLSRIPGAVALDGRASAHATIMVITYAALVQVTFLTFGKFSSAYLPYKSIVNL